MVCGDPHPRTRPPSEATEVRLLTRSSPKPNHSSEPFTAVALKPSQNPLSNRLGQIYNWACFLCAAMSIREREKFQSFQW